MFTFYFTLINDGPLYLRRLHLILSHFSNIATKMLLLGEISGCMNLNKTYISHVPVYQAKLHPNTGVWFLKNFGTCSLRREERGSRPFRNITTDLPDRMLSYPRSLVYMYQHFGGTCCIGPEEGGIQLTFVHIRLYCIVSENCNPKFG
jgi:hypothetical protein